MDPRIPYARQRAVFRPIHPQHAPYFLQCPVYPPASPYTTFIQAPPPFVQTSVAYATAGAVTAIQHTNNTEYYSAQPPSEIANTERPVKKSRALPIIDPKTGKNVIQSLKHEKVASVKPDVQCTSSSLPPPTSHHHQKSSSEPPASTSSSLSAGGSNDNPKSTTTVVAKKKEEVLVSSIKQIPKNLEHLSGKTSELKQNGPVGRKPPFGSISSRRGHACSPPFANQSYRSKKNETSGSRTANQSTNKSSGSIETSSPVQKTDHQEACGALSMEEVSSPIFNSITEGNLTDDFLSSTVKELSVEESKSTVRYTKSGLLNLKTSALVLIDPPALGSDILFKNLDPVVHVELFDKNSTSNNDDSCELSNSSYNNSSSNNNRYGAANCSKRSVHDYRQNDSHGSRNNNKTPERKGIIRVSLTQPSVKLNEAENAWKPSCMKSTVGMSAEQIQLETLEKNFRALLNKITAENFEHLAKDLSNPRKFSLNNSESLRVIIDILFEKSISEPGFAAIYAHLCKVMTSVVQFSEQDINGNDCKKAINPWKNCLISRCQSEFEAYARDGNTLKEIMLQVDNAKGSKEKDDLSDLQYLYRHRAQGTIKFIGELYKYDLLTSNIMRLCIDALLASVTEENITRACYLLTTVGRKLEESLTAESRKGGNSWNAVDSGRATINAYMNRLEQLKASECITTSRVRFEIMNVIDLRKANWVPRVNAKSNEAQPKTLSELKQESQLDLQRKQEMLNNYQPSKGNNMSSGPSSSSHNMGNRQNQRSKQQNYHQQNNRNLQSRSATFDFDKIPTHRNTDEKISFAPQQGLYKGMGAHQKPATLTSNSFGDLKVDCDDQEPLHNYSRSNSNNNSKNTRKQPAPRAQQVRSPSPDPASFASYDDMYTIELDNAEDTVKTSLLIKIQALIKGSLTMDMVIIDAKSLEITERILVMVYNEYLDKKDSQRSEFIETLVDLLKQNVISARLNIEALALLLKLVPSLECDVPLVRTYIGQFLVQLYAAELMTVNDIEEIAKDDSCVAIIEYFKSNAVVETETTAAAPLASLPDVIPESKSEQNSEAKVIIPSPPSLEVEVKKAEDKSKSIRPPLKKSKSKSKGNRGNRKTGNLSASASMELPKVVHKNSSESSSDTHIDVASATTALVTADAATSTAATTTPVTAAKPAPVTAVNPTAPVTAVNPTAPVTAVNSTAPVTAVNSTAPVTAVNPTAPVTAAKPTAPVTAATPTAPVTATAATPTAPVIATAATPTAPVIATATDAALVTASAKVETSPTIESPDASLLNGRTLNENCDLTKKIGYCLRKVCKKQKDLDDVFKLIDSSGIANKPNCVRFLTAATLKSYEHAKSTEKSDPSFFLVMRRYIDNDLKKGTECLNAIVETVVSDKVVHYFELFHENNVVTVESFKAWRDTGAKSEKKSRAAYLTQRFFVMLDEASE